MIDKEFFLEEIRERISKLREYEKVSWKRDACRERRFELERLVRQIESGIYDVQDEGGDRYDRQYKLRHSH